MVEPTIKSMRSFERQYNEPELQAKREERLTVREGLYDEIRNKVSIIQDARLFVRNYEHSTPEEFRKQCHEKMTTALSQFPPSTQEKYREYSELMKKKEISWDHIMERSDAVRKECGEGATEDDVDDARMGDTALDALNREYNSIANKTHALSDDDMEFLFTLETFFDDIAGKRQRVCELETLYGTEQEKFWECVPYTRELQEFLKKETGHIDVRFEGISIVLTVPSTVFERLHKKMVGGFYIPETPLIVIHQDVVDQRRVVQHEKNHNISDSFADEPQYAERLLESLRDKVKKIHTYEELGVPTPIVESEVRLLNREISRYVYRNFGEIIADFDESPQKQMQTFFSYLMRSINTIESYCKEIPAGRIRDELDSALERLLQEVVGYIGTLSTVFYIAETMGDMEEAQAAMLLFTPKTMHKVERYMRHRVGEENAAIMCALRPLVVEGTYFSFVKERDLYFHFLARDRSSRLLYQLNRDEDVESFLNFENIRTLRTLLHKKNDEKQEEFLATVRERISSDRIDTLSDVSSIEFYEDVPSGSPWLSAERVQQLSDSLREIGTILHISELQDFVERRLAYGYFDALLRFAIQKDDFSDCVRVYQEWQLSREKMNECIADYVREFAIEEYETFGKMYTKKTLRESKFWTFVETVGRAGGKSRRKKNT